MVGREGKEGKTFRTVIFIALLQGQPAIAGVLCVVVDCLLWVVQNNFFCWRFATVDLSALTRERSEEQKFLTDQDHTYNDNDDSGNSRQWPVCGAAVLLYFGHCVETSTTKMAPKKQPARGGGGGRGLFWGP